MLANCSTAAEVDIEPTAISKATEVTLVKKPVDGNLLLLGESWGS